MIQQIVQKMVNEQMENERKKMKLSSTGKTIPISPIRFKSPSEPTLYTPAIGKANSLENTYRPIVNNWEADDVKRLSQTDVGSVMSAGLVEDDIGGCSPKENLPHRFEAEQINKNYLQFAFRCR